MDVYWQVTLVGFGAMVFGLVLWSNADRVSRAMERGSRAVQPGASTRGTEPGWVRFGGVGFMVLGLVGAVMSVAAPDAF